MNKICKQIFAALFAAMPLIVMAQAKETKNHNFEVMKNLEIMNTVYKNLDMMYVDTLDPKETIGTGINAMLKSLDPYTEYYPETKELKTMLTGQYAGIGAMIHYHPRLKRVVIDEPYANTPSQKAGLRKGDIIIAIDDSSMIDKTVSQVSSKLRGDAGTSFVLTYQRPSTGKKTKVKITRQAITMPSVPYYGIKNNIGYINFNSFTEDCSKQLRQAFTEMKKQGIEGLILDLRNNGGGQLTEAVNTVNMFVPKDISIVKTKGKIKQANIDYKTRVEPIDTILPVVILVNNNSASAAEITAGALQDLDRAVVVGQRTYGKGLVQLPIDLPYNTQMKLTTSKYYIPSGRCIQAINYKHGGGGYKETIPDSLTNLFHTSNGREVRDGGGIKPDVEITPDSVPNIVYYLSGNLRDTTDVLFDYETDYIATHATIAPAADFHISDTDYADFKQRVLKSGFTYDRISDEAFKTLVKSAKFEGYYDEAKPEFDALEAKLKHDTEKDLDRNEKLIRQVIENDIVSAYYYEAGAVENSLNDDKTFLKAVDIIKNKEYEKILNNQ